VGGWEQDVTRVGDSGQGVLAVLGCWAGPVHSVGSKGQHPVPTAHVLAPCSAPPDWGITHTTGDNGPGAPSSGTGLQCRQPEVGPQGLCPCLRSHWGGVGGACLMADPVCPRLLQTLPRGAPCAAGGPQGRQCQQPLGHGHHPLRLAGPYGWTAHPARHGAGAGDGPALAEPVPAPGREAGG